MHPIFTVLVKQQAMGLEGSQSAGRQENEQETINIKNDIDFLLKSLETTRADEIRGNIKIVTDLLTAELADELNELGAEAGPEEE